jgi:uncharacterized membrane protein YphA (DoxX/SURF4 family)
MKIAYTVVRILLGALFVFSSVAYFIQLFPTPELTGAMKTFNEGMEASVYLLPLIKGIELIVGLAFLSGFFVPLASVIIAPIVVNIFFVHIFLAQEGLPVGLFVFFANAFLGFYNRERFKPLFVAK